MELGMYIMPPEYISKAYFVNPSLKNTNITVPPTAESEP
jgi:hypothetical protein